MVCLGIGWLKYPYLGIDNPQFTSDCSEGVGSVISLASHVFVLKNLRHPSLPSSKFIKSRTSLCYLDDFFLFMLKRLFVLRLDNGLYVIHNILAIIVFVDLISAGNLSQCRAAARYRDTQSTPITVPYRSRLRFRSAPPFRAFAIFRSFAMCPSFEPGNHVWPSFFKLVFTVRMALSLLASSPYLYHSDTAFLTPSHLNINFMTCPFRHSDSRTLYLMTSNHCVKSFH